MSELQIENPIQTVSYNLRWADIKTHVLKVVASFPAEYSVIKNQTDQIILLNIPVSPANKAIVKDQIIYIDNEMEGELPTSVKMVITNEYNKISSYTELERDKKALQVFTLLLKKSIEGTLVKTVAGLNAKQKPKADPAQAFIQLLLLIAALVAVFMGMKGLMH